MVVKFWPRHQFLLNNNPSPDLSRPENVLCTSTPQLQMKKAVDYHRAKGQSKKITSNIISVVETTVFQPPEIKYFICCNQYKIAQ